MSVARMSYVGKYLSDTANYLRALANNVPQITGNAVAASRPAPKEGLVQAPGFKRAKGVTQSAGDAPPVAGPTEVAGLDAVQAGQVLGVDGPGQLVNYQNNDGLAKP